MQTYRGNLVSGVAGRIGDTIATVNFNPSYSLGTMECNTCCPGGRNGGAIYLATVDFRVDIDIVVKYLNWVNPPEAQRRNWDRLRAAVLAHESVHVNDAKTLAGKLDGRRAEMGPSYALVCTLDPELAKQIVKKMQQRAAEAVGEESRRIAQKFADAFNKSKDDYHNSPGGGKIFIPDYIR